MVRGGQSYRTQAQRDHRHRSRGGNTRQQQMRKKVREENAYLSEKGLTRVMFSTKPITIHAADIGTRDASEHAVYGIQKTGTTWTLTGLSATKYTITAHKGEQKNQNRYVGTGTHGPVNPQDGIPIKTFSTKKAALNYINADGSERVEPGSYLVRINHNPRTRREKVPISDFKEFIETHAHRVWE